MKLRWHILFLLLASLCAILAGRWLQEPIWQVVDHRHIQFDKYDAAREEWSVIVGDSTRKQWWQETRSKRNPTVVKQLQLALPAMHEFSSIPYLGSHLTSRSNQCDPIICTDINNPNPNDARMYIGGRTYVLDANTGKLLRQFTTQGRFNCSTASHRIAFFESESICLFDTQTGIERKIVLQPFIKMLAIEFSPSGKWLGVVFNNNTLWLIEWSKGKLIDAFPEGKEVHACSFLSEDTILLSTSGPFPGSEHTRYQWDGSKLKQISPGYKLNQFELTWISRLNKTHQLHFLTHSSNDWPKSLRRMLQWLTRWNLPVERWYPKKRLEHWVVLDEQDQIIDRYDKPYSARHALTEHLSVEIDTKPGKPGATIRLWNLAPIWPNAVAIGLVMYLLLYVTGRCWVTRGFVAKRG